jgi:hypothetical protein
MRGVKWQEKKDMKKIKLKRGVYILECIDKHDPGSEGLFLAHMFRLMSVPHQHLEVQTKDQFLALLPRSPYELIHIATHGYVDRSNGSNRFAGLWFRDGHVTVSDLDGLGNALRGQSVILTACLSGDRAVAKALITKGACRYVVAPQGAPYFHNAIFFAHLFYHHYFINERSVAEILVRYDKRYRNPHQFAGVPLRKYGLSFVP